jgi:hypothetical protein
MRKELKMRASSEIAEAGRGTRFGQSGTDPVGAAKKGQPWSIRNAIRRAVTRARQDGKPTAHAVAETLIEMALDGDLRACEVLIEPVDGKVL